MLLNDSISNNSNDDLKLTKEEMERESKDYIPIICGVIKTLQINDFDNKELISVGSLGFTKALHSYRKNKKTKFTTYAYVCIKNELIGYIKKKNKIESKTLSLNSIISVNKNGSDLLLENVLVSNNKECLLEELAINNEQCDFLIEAIKELPEKEREVIFYRYGLNGYEEKTQKELAKKINMSQANVSKIQEKAINKLKLILERYI